LWRANMKKKAREESPRKKATKKDATTASLSPAPRRGGALKGRNARPGAPPRPRPQGVPASALTPGELKCVIELQTAARGWLGRRRAARLRGEREREVVMQAEMEQLRQQAWLAQVQYERRKAAEAAKKKQEEARRKREVERITNAMLDAAFEGDDSAMLALMEEAEKYGVRRVAETHDAHGNTVLSEAAAGGSLSTVQLLLSKGADPNSRGEFERTPLFRAAFAGNGLVIAPLLEAGADPRLPNKFGEQPQQVASSPQIRGMIDAWDIRKTDALVAAFAERRAVLEAQEKAHALEEMASAEGNVAVAQELYDRLQMALRKAFQERERLIVEYDTAIVENRPEGVRDTLLRAVEDAEGRLEVARAEGAKAGEDLQAAKLALREKQHTVGGDDQLPGVHIELRELNDVLMKDVGDRMRGDGRWPLVVDWSRQSGVFLRYADTNYLNALSVSDMSPDSLRRALLGAIRYGKPLVVDFMDADMWSSMPRLFGEVKGDLWHALLSKELLADERYMDLVKPEDGQEYQRACFSPDRLNEFKLVLLSSARHPNDEALTQMYPIWIKVRGG